MDTMINMDDGSAPSAMAPGQYPQIVVQPSSEILTRPVLIGAGVGFLAKGVTGAIIGAILGSLWRRR